MDGRSGGRLRLSNGGNGSKRDGGRSGKGFGFCGICIKGGRGGGGGRILCYKLFFYCSFIFLFIIVFPY